MQSCSVLSPSHQRVPRIKPDVVETFALDGGTVQRRVRGSRRPLVTALANLSTCVDAGDAFEQSWLKSRTWPEAGGGRPLRWVDLFSGCGGLSLGVWEATRA